jgi:hypothetical protein
VWASSRLDDAKSRRTARFALFSLGNHSMKNRENISGDDLTLTSKRTSLAGFCDLPDGEQPSARLERMAGCFGHAV